MFPKAVFFDVYFISLLVSALLFYFSRFYSIYILCHFACMRFFFFKTVAMYALDTVEYMNRQQQPDKTARICCRDAQAYLDLRCPRKRKEPFSHDMTVSTGKKVLTLKSSPFKKCS